MLRTTASLFATLLLAVSLVGCGQSEPPARSAADPKFDAATNPQHAAATNALSGAPAPGAPAGGHAAAK